MPATLPPASDSFRFRRGKWIAIAGIVLLVLAAFIFGDPPGWLNACIAAVERLGHWGPVVFVLVYIAATVLFVPGFALTLSAGALFGVVAGTAIVSLASTAAAALSFLIGRFLARDAVAVRIAGNPTLASLDHALERDGWKVVALTRLSPLFPFALLNYSFGLTRVRFTHYVLTSWLAMLPATVLYVYLGSLARAGARSGEKSPWEWALYGAGLLATVAITVFITRTARQALREKGLAPGGPAVARKGE